MLKSYVENGKQVMKQQKITILSFQLRKSEDILTSQLTEEKGRHSLCPMILLSSLLITLCLTVLLHPQIICTHHVYQNQSSMVKLQFTLAGQLLLLKIIFQIMHQHTIRTIKTSSNNGTSGNEF